MRKLIILGFLVLEGAVALVPGEPILSAPDRVDPGGVVQVVLSGERVDSVSVSLLDNRGRAVSRTESFQWRSPGGNAVSVALLGVPSSLRPGRYHLVAYAEEGRAKWQLEKFLTVRSRNFPERVITLDDRMNALYSDDSERKKSEARILWDVLTAFDPDAVHHVGPLILPFDEPVITSEFGDRRRYRMPDGSETASVHFGRDLWAEKGTPVGASGRGRVVMAVERFLTGNTVILEHLPGVYSLYYHLDSISVRVGEMIPQESIVGALGDTGFVTGAHLHWELRVGGVPVAPEVFLERPLLDTDRLISKMD